MTSLARAAAGGWPQSDDDRQPSALLYRHPVSPQAASPLASYQRKIAPSASASGGKRHTSGITITDQAQAIAWKKAHPEKVREHRMNLYWRRRKILLESLTILRRLVKQPSPELLEERRQRRMAYAKNRAKADPAQNARETRLWQKRHSRACSGRSKSARRRARSRGATGSHTGQEVLDLLKTLKVSVRLLPLQPGRKNTTRTTIIRRSPGAGQTTLKTSSCYVPAATCRKNAKDSSAALLQEMGMLL